MAEESRFYWPQGMYRLPDGISGSVPVGRFGGIGGTYYFNPGSASAPRVTVTGSLGVNPGYSLHGVFLRNGMTSQDTLGYGATANGSTILPSVSVNTSIPDEDYVPRPWEAKVSSIETGIGSPGASGAITYTSTPDQIADWINRYISPPAMGPQDELTPFARSLQSKSGSVGVKGTTAVPFLNSQEQNPLGAGMAGWGTSATPPSVFQGGAPPVPHLPASQDRMGGLSGLLASAAGPDPWDATQPAPLAGGLLGLIQDYMRNNPGGGSAP